MIINNKPELYLIVEGKTEKLFFERIEKLLISKYNIYIITADSKERILKKYHDQKAKNSFSETLVLYDLDNIDSLDSIYARYKKRGLLIKKSDIYYINPDIETLLLLCKSSLLIKDKLTYCLNFQKYYNIKNYRKTEKQLEKIMKQINSNDIINLLSKIKQMKINNDTNIDKLFNKLYGRKENERIFK